MSVERLFLLQNTFYPLLPDIHRYIMLIYLRLDDEHKIIYFYNTDDIPSYLIVKDDGSVEERISDDPAENKTLTFTCPPGCIHKTHSRKIMYVFSLDRVLALLVSYSGDWYLYGRNIYNVVPSTRHICKIPEHIQFTTKGLNIKDVVTVHQTGCIFLTHEGTLYLMGKGKHCNRTYPQPEQIMSHPKGINKICGGPHRTFLLTRTKDIYYITHGYDEAQRFELNIGNGRIIDTFYSLHGDHYVLVLNDGDNRIKYRILVIREFYTISTTINIETSRTLISMSVQRFGDDTIIANVVDSTGCIHRLCYIGGDKIRCDENTIIVREAQRITYLACNYAFVKNGKWMYYDGARQREKEL